MQVAFISQNKDVKNKNSVYCHIHLWYNSLKSFDRISMIQKKV